MCIVHIQRNRTDLHRVRIISRVLKQTIIRIEHLAGEKEEELSCWSTIVQTANRQAIVSTTQWSNREDKGKVALFTNGSVLMVKTFTYCSEVLP